MTIEEAGEIILRGEPWEACGSCDCTGRGIAVTAMVVGLDREGKKCEEMTEITGTCGQCKGFGIRERVEYEDARLFLGLPKPEYPVGVTEYSSVIGTREVWTPQQIVFADGTVWSQGESRIHGEMTFTQSSKINSLSINGLIKV